jgi:hypothetical protein
LKEGGRLKTDIKKGRARFLGGRGRLDEVVVDINNQVELGMNSRLEATRSTTVTSS